MRIKDKDCQLNIKIDADLEFIFPPKSIQEEIIRKEAVEVVRLFAYSLQPVVCSMVKLMMDVKTNS